MSNHLTSLAYKVNVGSLLRKSVLVLLADKASDDGSGIWASKQTMADELCCSKQAVIKSMNEFQAEGLLRETGTRKNPNGYTVTYTLNVAAIEALPKVKRWASDQSTPLTGQSGSPVNDVDVTSQPGLPKPPLTTLGSEAKASSPKSAKQSEWHPLPDGWVPTRPLSQNTLAMVENWPPGAFASELESFRAWAGNAEPKKGKGLKKDWDDAFGNWIRSAHRDRYTKLGRMERPRTNPLSEQYRAICAAAASAGDEDYHGTGVALPPARYG